MHTLMVQSFTSTEEQFEVGANFNAFSAFWSRTAFKLISGGLVSKQMKSFASLFCFYPTYN